MPVMEAKTSANLILMRMSPGIRVDCVSKLVLASLSAVCRSGLLVLQWDLTA